MSSRSPISINSSSSSDTEEPMDAHAVNIVTAEKSEKRVAALRTTPTSAVKGSAAMVVSESITSTKAIHPFFGLDVAFKEEDSSRQLLVQQAVSSVTNVTALPLENKKRAAEERTVQTLDYPKTCPNVEMMIGHLPLWKVLSGSGKEIVKKSRFTHTLPKVGEKVAKRSNSDENLDGVPAPPAWAVTPQGRIKRGKTYYWNLSLDQIRAYLLGKETYRCPICGEDRLPSQLEVKQAHLTDDNDKMNCTCAICSTLAE